MSPRPPRAGEGIRAAALARAQEPDGKFAAYTSDETGRPEIWVQTLPDPSARWRVSIDGGRWQCWSDDGNELYYLDPDRELLAMPVTWREESGSRVPEFGIPKPLFRMDAKPHSDRQYDTIDGTRFLVNHIVQSAAEDPLTLIQG